MPRYSLWFAVVLLMGILAFAGGCSREEPKSSPGVEVSLAEPQSQPDRPAIPTDSFLSEDFPAWEPTPEVLSDWYQWHNLWNSTGEEQNIRLLCKRMGEEQYTVYLHRGDTGERALLTRDGPIPRVYRIMDGYGVLWDGGLTLLDNGLFYQERQPELPPAWTLDQVLPDAGQGFALVCRSAVNKEILYFDRDYWQEHIPTPWDAENYDYDYEIQRSGDKVFYTTEHENGLHCYDLISGGLTHYSADSVFFQPDWIIAICQREPEDPDYKAFAKQEVEGAYVSLWLAGELAGTRWVKEITYDQDTWGIDAPVNGVYDPSADSITVCQPIVQYTFSLDGGGVERQDYFPPLEYPAAQSDDGRYKVYHVSRGMHSRAMQYYSLFVEDEETGEKNYFLHDIHNQYREKLENSGTTLYRCYANELYDLATGEKLDITLQFPQGMDWELWPGVEGVWPAVLAFVHIPEQELYLTARLLDYDDYPQSGEVRLELFDSQGRFLQELRPGIYAGFTWTGAATEYLPLQLATQRQGSRVLVESRGQSRYDFPWNYQDTLPGVSVVDVESTSWYSLPAHRWVWDGDILVTAWIEPILGEERDAYGAYLTVDEVLHLCRYVNGQLAEEFTAQVPQGDWDLVYTGSTGGAALVDEEEETIEAFQFTVNP